MAVDSQEAQSKYLNDDDGLKKTCELKPNTPFIDNFDFSEIYIMIAPDLLHQGIQNIV